MRWRADPTPRLVDVILPTGALSVYEFTVDLPDLVPTESETHRCIETVERRYPDRGVLEREVEAWWAPA